MYTTSHTVCIVVDDVKDNRYRKCFPTVTHLFRRHHKHATMPRKLHSNDKAISNLPKEFRLLFVYGLCLTCMSLSLLTICPRESNTFATLALSAFAERRVGCGRVAARACSCTCTSFSCDASAPSLSCIFNVSHLLVRPCASTTPVNRHTSTLTHTKRRAHADILYACTRSGVQ